MYIGDRDTDTKKEDAALINNANDNSNELTSKELMNAWRERYPGPSLYSTDSDVITFSGVLYNVSGSTADPDEVHDCIGCSWRELLEKKIPGSGKEFCYVENSKAKKDSSHYKTGWRNVVGGHMTKNKDGHVKTGGNSFLIPLCKWDNSTDRNEEPFQVTNRKILVLKGYMLPELFVTFAARLPAIGDTTFGLVYLDEERDIWRHKDINAEQAKSLSSANPQDPNQYILIEKAANVNESCKLQDVCM